MCPSLLISAILIVIGLVLCLLEVLVIPGFITGLAGFAMVVFGIVKAYVLCGPSGGNLMLISTIVLTAAMIAFVAKSGKLKKMALKTEMDSKVNVQIAEDVKVGDRAESFDRLAPIGHIKIGDRILDAKSIGPFINPSSTVEVVAVTDQYVIVKPVQ